MSSPKRIARILDLYLHTDQNEGIYFNVQKNNNPQNPSEYRLLLGIANPPNKSLLLQLLEVFHRLELSVKRSYSLLISNGRHPYFLANFYVIPKNGIPLDDDSELFKILKKETYNTQILSIESLSYKNLVKTDITSGVDATFVDAMVSFCHTNLSHNHPESYTLESITRSFHHHPDIAIQLIELFNCRFDPFLDEREKIYDDLYQSLYSNIDHFNTGRRFLDSFRRNIFLCALSFIKHTLKTNFYVAEKHALAFRLDPSYLDELDEKFTSNLPLERPFRITFFFGRNGCGYHIGFADIARGGWRTLITKGRDDYVTHANSMFKENYVLAHTQHLKNKDIYEGGSKMVTILQLSESTPNNIESINQQLYKLQFSFINAFLDVFITEDGSTKDPQVVDYYNDDEPIELGPDENMHDVMVETIAKLGVKRQYILGSGIMSSKEVGINHKDYGVTSFGVIRFAEVTLSSLGINMHKDSFSVKFTGGPNGDVAGNCIKLLHERCPEVRIRLIIDGSGVLYDPLGLDKQALSKIVLNTDLEDFDDSSLSVDGYLLYRNEVKQEGMKTLFKRATMTKTGLVEEWVSTDEFHKIFNSVLFDVEADLFIPAGGRPETIDIDNVGAYFTKEGQPSAKVIVEGANSFITPDARDEMQRRGVVLIRDASANKCGVISSSYEIIANLLLTDEEFMTNKQQYVSDVMDLLNYMAEQEASLIIERYKQPDNKLSYTDISDQLSLEINEHYKKIFYYFQQNPKLVDNSIYQKVMLKNLPMIIVTNSDFTSRLSILPEKVKYAILASTLSTSIVYGKDIYAEIIEVTVSKIARANEG